MSVLSDTPLSLTATRELLEQLEHLPKKKLGQNFLVDQPSNVDIGFSLLAAAFLVVQ